MRNGASSCVRFDDANKMVRESRASADVPSVAALEHVRVTKNGRGELNTQGLLQNWFMSSSRCILDTMDE